MTTKPKARKFRIRRTETGAPEAAAPPQQAAQATQAAPDMAPNPPPNLDGPMPVEGEFASPREVNAEVDIDAIRKEGLTGRQLRMARRLALKHGLAPISDFDAVRQLRLKGIDPLQRDNMLELVVPKTGAGGDGGKTPGTAVAKSADGDGRMQLPQTMKVSKDQLPSTDTVSPAERRAVEIMDIQRDIVRRRRKRMFLLLTRLSAFVFLPTILTGWYYFAIATPLYATKSAFMILQADNQGGTGFGGLLPTNYATSQDSIAVQDYMQSKDALVRLDKEQGYKAHFSQDSIDPIQRLAADASNETAHKLYRRNVKIGYDPTEGVVRMEVIAATPEASARFATALISYAEERVDDLSKKKRKDAMATSQTNLATAEADYKAKQAYLISLKEKYGADPTQQITVLRQQIATYENQLFEKELELSSLRDNPRPNRPKVDAAERNVKHLKALIKRLNSKMNDPIAGKESLAAQATKMEVATADLATAELFLNNALQTKRQTESEAERQVRYLTVSVKPVEAEAPTYPRAFENTILAFLIFAGVYLMVSLTSSILREQVSN